MAKKCSFLFIFLFCAVQLFAAYEAELANFDKNFATSNDKLKFHHQLTSLYIQSMMNDDDKSKKELLKRLIISSQSLNLDPTTYKNELKNLENKTAFKPLFVLHSQKQENALTLTLSQDLDKKDLRISELKEKGNYRYIIDFDASLDGGRKEFDFNEARVLLAQFDKKTTRLVIHAKNELEYSLNLKNKTLNLSLKTSQSNSSASNSNKVPQIQAQKPSNTQTKPQKQHKLYILKSNKSSNGVKLSLSDELDEKEIKQIRMKDKGIYRIVLSFEATLDGGRKHFSFGNDTITLTQYSSKVVRVVFNSKNDFEVLKKSEGKSLFLSFDKGYSPPKQTNLNTSKTTSKPSQKNPKRTGSQNKIIVIDAGHGGKDGGAVGNDGKWIEKDIVLKVSLKIGDELKKKGYKVFYTRVSDKFINLRDRTKIANDKKANLFISIHANAAINKSKAKTMQGIETFFLSPARSERSKEVAALENKADLEEANFFLKQNFLSALNREKIIASNRLAIDIQKGVLGSVRKKYKVVDGGVREAPFWVLVGAQDMPAVLVEIGYISHQEEGKRLLNETYQKLVAQGIAQGVEAYFHNNADE